MMNIEQLYIGWIIVTKEPTVSTDIQEKTEWANVNFPQKFLGVQLEIWENVNLI